MRMVIRSTLGELPTAYVQLGRITDLEGHTDAGLEYLDANDRHVAPPLGSQQLAEWHAKFDAAIGRFDRIGEPERAVRHREARIGLVPAGRPERVRREPGPPRRRRRSSRRPGRRRTPSQSGEYVCHDVDQLDLPYLPDPMSVGASFTSLPGDRVPGCSSGNRPAANAPWYDRRPLRVRIEDGAGPPVYDATQRLLTVLLPQAEMVTVNLSSYLDRRHAGAVRSVDDPAQHLPSVAPTPRPQPSEGAAWMLTPWSRAHAGARGREAARATGDRGARRRRAEHRRAALRRRDVRGARRGSCRTTPRARGRLDVEAKWSEPVDDVLQARADNARGHRPRRRLPTPRVRRRVPDRPRRRARLGNAAAEARAAARVHGHQAPLRHLPGDRDARASASTSRPRSPTTATLITHTGPEVAAQRAVVAPAGSAATCSTSCRRGRGRNRPCAASPCPDRVQRPASTLLRTRTGGGLRVYMDRPWWSSGVDELLGVVLEDQPWLTWPIDVEAGHKCRPWPGPRPRSSRTRRSTNNSCEPAGKVTAAASERLLAGVSRASASWYARRARRARPSARRRDRVSHDAALRTALQHRADLDRLSDLIGQVLPPERRPAEVRHPLGPRPDLGLRRRLAGPYIHQFPLRAAVG